MNYKCENRVLIILKRKYDYNGEIHSYIGLSTGLYNSAKYIDDMLLSNDIVSKIIVVIDNNDIDREVSIFNPTHVIIEALWVVPEKFDILTKLHPKVKWIIRLHSQLPFIAMEGNAMKWINEYFKKDNVIIAVNSIEMLHEIRMYYNIVMGHEHRHLDHHYHQNHQKVIYLPNYYPKVDKLKNFDNNCNEINISCFGAIRPLKNHLTQAFAAIEFANKIGKKLIFHINGNRVEQKGEPILQNLISLFESLSECGHKLILHDWLTKEEFLILCAKMDMGLQCSFSETFNIVGADLLSQGVPLVGSSEIPWIESFFAADPTKSDEILKKLIYTYKTPSFNVKQNQRSLNKYTYKSEHIWLEFLKTHNNSHFL